MPLWRSLEKSRNRRANLISMEATTYDKTPLAEKKPISAVPTVLFVNKEGQIAEASAPRNLRVMSNAVQRGISEPEAAASMSLNASSPLFTVSRTASAAPDTAMSPAITPVIPGTQVRSNPLEPLPATPVSSVTPPMVGGSPWAAFMSAARQAAPAAALLGAYAMTRSSGLGPTRKHTRRHRRRSSSRRKND